MERTIEFKNMNKTDTSISADLYLDGLFVMRIADSVSHLLMSQHKDVTIYQYFRQAMLQYLNQYESQTPNISYQPFKVESSTKAH